MKHDGKYHGYTFFSIWRSKTTLTKKFNKVHNFKISVSHTTRPPRTNEVDGVDYNFVSKKNFKN